MHCSRCVMRPPPLGQRRCYSRALTTHEAYTRPLALLATAPTGRAPGVRRRPPDVESVYQQGTFSPNDGVQCWMGSVAQDRQGNMALGYSVTNATTVFLRIRDTGRLAADPLGQMTLGEGTIINGSGAQTTTNSRWGDYTSLNVDPVDDCTFWYVNGYYTAAGQASSPAGWQTRIANFTLPGCVAPH